MTSMIGYCPTCLARLKVSEYAETVRCVRCRDMYHPEHLLSRAQVQRVLDQDRRGP